MCWKGWFLSEAETEEEVMKRGADGAGHSTGWERARILGSDRTGVQIQP